MTLTNPLQSNPFSPGSAPPSRTPDLLDIIAQAIDEAGYITDKDNSTHTLYIYRETFPYRLELHLEDQTLTFIVPTIRTAHYDLTHANSIDDFLTELHATGQLLT